MVLALCAGVLPFIVLSFYTVPNLEDYAESIIPNVWWHVKFLYLTYDGRVFTSFLFAALNPLKFEWFFGYQLIPIALFIALYFTYVFLFQSLSPTKSKAKYLVGGFALIFFLLRNTNTADCFYFLTSSYVYLVPGTLFLFFTGQMVQLMRREETSFLQLAALSLLIFCVAAGNELLLIPLLVVLLIAFVWNYKANGKKLKALLILSLALGCSYYIVFSSPGLQAHFYEHQTNKDIAYFINAVSQSITFTFHHLMEALAWNFTLPLLAFLLLLVFKKYRKTTEALLSFKHLHLVFISMVLLGLLIIFPYTWAAGEKGSIEYTQIYIIPYLYYTVIFTVYLYQLSFFMPFEISNAKGLVYSLVVLIFVLQYFDASSKINLAYADWFSGRAKHYHQEVKTQIEESLKSPDRLEICMLKHQPETIFHGMYFNTASELFHVQYKMYYNIDEIAVKECP